MLLFCKEQKGSLCKSDTVPPLYTRALENMAIVKAGELRLQASKKSVAVARAGFVPEVSFFANLNTNYSSLAQIFNETGSSIIETGDYVNFSGVDYPVLREEPNFAGEDISYNDQFENNLYSAVGIYEEVSRGADGTLDIALDTDVLGAGKVAFDFDCGADDGVGFCHGIASVAGPVEVGSQRSRVHRGGS